MSYKGKIKNKNNGLMYVIIFAKKWKLLNKVKFPEKKTMN